MNYFPRVDNVNKNGESLLNTFLIKFNKYLRKINDPENVLSVTFVNVTLDSFRYGKKLIRYTFGESCGCVSMLCKLGMLSMLCMLGILCEHV